jgi:hypothetical protein
MDYGSIVIEFISHWLTLHPQLIYKNELLLRVAVCIQGAALDKVAAFWHRVMLH